MFLSTQISAITPPVALAAYAGANIAQAPMMQTGFMATRLGLVAFIIPFYFCFKPAILLENGLLEGVLEFSLFAIGIFVIIIGIEGWFKRNLSIVIRVFLIIVGLGAIIPYTQVQITSFVFIGIYIIFNMIIKKRKLNSIEET